MQQTQTNKPISLNMDKSLKQLTELEAFYLLNHERYVNVSATSNGASLGKTTGIVANYAACEIENPVGENYCIGTYRSPITNEVYSFHYNSNNVHYILRITNEGCEIVYHGLLDFSADPKHAIEEWRVHLKYDPTCKNGGGKQLIWCDGKQDYIGQLDVEASIATNSFTTPFFDRCTDGKEMIQMGVPKPCGCISAEYIKPTEADLSKTNHLLDVGFKFMYRHVYYDERASEWSDMSTLYFQNTKGCFDTTQGFSRCMRLRIPIGNALVDKIEIAFSKGDNTWYLSEVVEKYKAYNSNEQQWYERTLAENIINSGYSERDCSFDYIFCNDKQCQEIDPTQVSRVYNPIPRKPQGLIRVKDALGFYNYEDGACPIAKTEVEKFKVELECDDTVDCTPEYATVTVRAIIHNTSHSRNQFVYRLGAGGEDDPADTAFFGGLNKAGDIAFGDPTFNGGLETSYDQQFKGKVRNFIAYIDGTQYFAEMKQWRSDAYFKGSKREYGIVPDMGSNKTIRDRSRDIDNGKFFYQEAKIKVKKGTRGFIRLASHHAEGNEQDTSTYVDGIFGDLIHYKGDLQNFNYDRVNKEFYFDTSKGDVEVKGAFVIKDHAVDAGVQNAASSYSGYITDKNGAPIEGLKIATDIALGLDNAPTTDHNGFYHFHIESGVWGAITRKIYGELAAGGAFAELKTFTLNGVVKGTVQVDEEVDIPAYNDNYYAKVNAKVVDCNGQGIGGIRVSLSGSKYKVTLLDGIATFNIRNYHLKPRFLRAVVLDYGGCLELACDGACNPTLPATFANAPTSFAGVPPVPMSSMVINIDSVTVNKRGLKNGGRYGFGIVVEGGGRISAVNETNYLEIPKAQEKGKVSYCGFKYDATSLEGMRLPSWGECLKIVRTPNLNPYELQWKVDKIERIGSNKIKLTIQSLNDYNEEYFFKTNTSYQYLKGDRIEFIRNGDGKIFRTADHGVLNYLTLSPHHDKLISGKEEADADFFNQLLIEDDGKLASLKEGAVIELQRQQDCVNEPAYYEVCASIPIVNERLLHESGLFTTFDTYLINRQIGSDPVQTFEHHSPSDFWGDKLSDLGRAHIVNRYANERRYGRNISINAKNQFNYFGDLVKTFDAPEQGDIVAMGIVDGKVILAIGEHDNFLAMVSDDMVRVGKDGTIRAAPADSIISNGEPKLSGQFGCQYPHIGSILFGDGWVTWCDVNKHSYIKHNYESAQAVSMDRVQSFFQKRCQQIETINRTATEDLNKYRFATGYNFLNGSVYITIKSLRDSGINNEKAAYAKPNDTIVYHPESNDWLGFASFTAEAYSQFDLFDANGCAFVSFINGVPYIHPVIPEKWNEFFGVSCDRVVGVAINKFPEKIKKPVSIEVQDQQMWFVHEVKTETNFKSEIPPVRWKKNEDKWNAAFLGNQNSRGGLYGDDKARGYQIAVVFVRDNTDNLRYGSIDNSKRVSYSELDMILFKFTTSESSGFTENV